MLKQFRRMEKTRSVVILFFAFVLVLGLVVAGVYNRTGVAVANPFKSREVIAEVRGDEVTVADLALRKGMLEQRMGGQFSLAQLGMTDERLLDQLINERIAVQEAERLGLLASEAEVADAIRRQFSDATTPFDLKRYKDYVVRNFGSVQLYEKSVRDGIAVEKLRAFVTAGAQVSEDEVRREWERRNTKFDLVYVPVLADELARNVNVSDEELQKFYEERKTDFRILEPQKNVRYLFINQEKAGARINISEEELRKEYDQLSPENKQAGVRVQQIVLKVASPELDQQVLQKATELAQRVRGEDLKASAEAFAELARGNSEDPATAKNGGWLPGVVRKNPNAKDLLQNTLTMEEGQVSDPMKTGNAYYVFRRGESIPKTFEEASKELMVSLRNRRAYAVAAQVAQRAAERVKETKDLQKVAQEIAPEVNMQPSEMIRETGFVKPGDDVPEIGSNPTFEQAIAPLEEPGQVGDRVAIKGGFAIPVLVEKRDPRIPELAEVRDKVLDAARRERARQQIDEIARQLASNSAGPDALKAAAEKLGLKPQTQEGYALGTPLGTVGTDPALDAAIAALKAGEVTRTPVKVGDTTVVVAASKRADPDPAEFGKQRTDLLESALEERRGEIYDEYVASTRRRLEQSGDVEINREALDRLAQESAPPAAFPAGSGGVPITIPE